MSHVLSYHLLPYKFPSRLLNDFSTRFPIVLYLLVVVRPFPSIPHSLGPEGPLKGHLQLCAASLCRQYLVFAHFVEPRHIPVETPGSGDLSSPDFRAILTSSVQNCDIKVVFLTKFWGVLVIL